jgi:hypothetical protein
MFINTLLDIFRFICFADIFVFVLSDAIRKHNGCSLP